MRKLTIILLAMTLLSAAAFGARPRRGTRKDAAPEPEKAGKAAQAEKAQKAKAQTAGKQK